MCKSIVGFDDEEWGSVSSNKDGLTFEGENPTAVKRLFESMRIKGWDDDKLVRTMPYRLRGRLWAENVDNDADRDPEAEMAEGFGTYNY